MENNNIATYRLTRTIKVSCLSCFLHDSEPLTGTSAQPGTRIRAAARNKNSAP